MPGDTSVIFAGAATVYVAPVNEALPEIDDLTPPAVTVTPAGNWVEVEFIADTVGLSASEEIQHVRVLASDLPVKAFKTEEEIEVTFASQDRSLAALGQFHGAFTALSAVAAGADQSAQDQMGIGDGSIKEFAMLIILTNQDAGDRIIHLYKVMSNSSLKQNYGKEHESWDVGFTVMADLTKAAGQRAGVIYDITATPTS